mmetsp:Transcript_22237/g.58023  ORF Transcript_22237/g.58023 Transcript_22237/m.58023 type:complete len:232 (+) Transcript_22237:327-1022(+)
MDSVDASSSSAEWYMVSSTSNPPEASSSSAPSPSAAAARSSEPREDRLTASVSARSRFSSSTNQPSAVSYPSSPSVGSVSSSSRDSVCCTNPSNLSSGIGESSRPAAGAPSPGSSAAAAAAAAGLGLGLWAGLSAAVAPGSPRRALALIAAKTRCSVAVAMASACPKSAVSRMSCSESSVATARSGCGGCFRTSATADSGGHSALPASTNRACVCRSYADTPPTARKAATA